MRERNFKRIIAVEIAFILITIGVCFTATKVNPVYAESIAIETKLSEDTISGSFPYVAGKDIASIRYYVDVERSTYECAEFSYNKSTNSYEYSFKKPYEGFEQSEAKEDVGKDTSGNATIVAEYFNTKKWDGAVDVSWYDENAADYYIDTPAKLAGLAAIVNGVFDGSIKDYDGNEDKYYYVKGDTNLVNAEYKENSNLIGGATGGAYTANSNHDFANKTVHITADLDMGGVTGEKINHSNNSTQNNYDYPNWTPIGGEYLMDNAVATSMVLSSFNGVLDGGGHNITNLYCYRYAYPGWQYAQGTGLVGCIGVIADENKSLSQVPAVRNLSVSGYVYGRRMVGGIVGLVGGGDNTHGTKSADTVRLENLASHVYVYNTDSKGIGGVVGTSYVKDGSIINCYFDGKVTTTYASPAGGIIGANEHMDIFSCYCRGTINTGTAHYGRGIGGTGNSAGDFTVDSCFYLKGCGDDSTYPGYYQYNLPDSIYVNVTEQTDAQMKDGTLLNGLNVNGRAYVADDNGYPVLLWEKESGNGNLTITNPQGGTISADRTGNIPFGTVVYLSCTAETGWNFRYFTLSEKEMTGDYVTIGGNANVSAYMEPSKAGTLKIKQNSVCNISVRKNGLIKDGNGDLIEVNGVDVDAGDSLYEGDILMVNATLKEGVVPSDVSMDYGAAVGMNNPYTYTFTYSGEEESTSSSPRFTVDSRINKEDVALTLDVTALTTPKLWHNTVDTSWYTGDQTKYTLTSAEQLAGLDKLVEGGNTFEGITISLGSDISLANTDGTNGVRSWDGIGDDEHAFAGTFDGQGHKITDYNGVSRGLFAYCLGKSASNPAIVKGVEIYGNGSGANASGIVAKAGNTQISGCSSYVAIDSGNAYVGGILGNDTGGTQISNCFNYGNIFGVGKVGGITGNVSATGSLADNINYGDIKVLSVAANQVGGIAGDHSGSMQRCANYGNVLAYGRNIGGLAGETTDNSSSIIDCYNVGSVTYESGISLYDGLGGLIGFGSIYKIANSFNYGDVVCNSGVMSTNVGSLIGRHAVSGGKINANSQSSITNTYVKAMANSNDYVIAGFTLSELKKANADFFAGLNEVGADSFADSTQVLGDINDNDSYMFNNGKYPEIKAVSSAHVHSGGVATCSSQAVCEVCGLFYGELDPDNHEEIEITNKKDAIWAYDGYTGDESCSACGKVLEQGSVVHPDTSREVMTVVVKKDGQADESKTYTVAELDDIKTTSPVIGYMFSAKSEEAMASTEYITLKRVLQDFSMGMNNIDSLKVICSGSTQEISGDDIRSCIWYFDKDGKKASAPPAFCITYSTETGSLDKIAAVAQSHDDLRFGYGISQKQYDDKEVVGGRRCVSPVERVEITYKEAVGVKVSGKIEGIDGDAEIKLISESGAENTLVERGIYSFENIAEGDYTLSISADGYVTNTYAISVEGNSVEQDIEIYKLGDVNKDGVITSTDVTMIGRHVARIETIKDEYTLKLCDVTRDGSITAADTTKLGRYVAKIINDL